ncbi:hypothetical protein C7S13_6962 [Burkholderia cepacia]|nr:hypothetical protein [Burkholderia cepacia]
MRQYGASRHRNGSVRARTLRDTAPSAPARGRTVAVRYRVTHALVPAGRG